MISRRRSGPTTPTSPAKTDISPGFFALGEHELLALGWASAGTTLLKSRLAANWSFLRALDMSGKKYSGSSSSGRSPVGIRSLIKGAISELSISLFAATNFSTMAILRENSKVELRGRSAIPSSRQHDWIATWRVLSDIESFRNISRSFLKVSLSRVRLFAMRKSVMIRRRRGITSETGRGVNVSTDLPRKSSSPAVRRRFMGRDIAAAASVARVVADDPALPTMELIVGRGDAASTGDRV